MAPKWYQIRVVTFDATLEFKIKPSSSGRELFNQVCSTVGLREVWYFGLTYIDPKGVQKWVKLNKKISTVCKSKDGLMEFCFKVKFYPEEVSEELIQDITQRLFYFEVKKYIVSGDIYCSADGALLLASYQAVIRHGKYDETIHKPGYLDISKYIPEHIRKQYTLTDEEWEAKISKWHEQHGDISKQDAIMEYLKVAQDLEMYGISYFQIKNNKQTPLWLGVDALGLNIYGIDDRLTPKVSFPWNEARKLAYSHCKFTVKPTDTTAKDLVFYCDSTSTCKLVLALCTGNHELYARRRGPDSIEVQQMKAQAKEMKNARDMERERLLAERRSRELMEERYLKMERAMQEQEIAYEISQSTLTDYQLKVKKLESQLEEEKRVRMELQAMQRRLEEVNQQLELESAASVDERLHLRQERDMVMEQIEQQQRLIEEQAAEKHMLEIELAKRLDLSPINGDLRRDSGEQELQCLDGLQKPEDDRQALTVTDMDHAKRLEMMRRELDPTRDRRKLQQVDIRYEENVSRGMDKYRTLHAIRQGNTKKRVDQFESM
ncbi:hypothetical protein EG68_05434 [Paragonimus skrjabini miyazakii]|uniref:FERM domain-containing protein n=1 Tax=Paragonimus skrjabini miyazakii TaxID=59628 RepID=A0A8S9YW97_9TREM|nr:hypothetical protein EG68_05434 [Paragonimus skrjabini miyazakii]